MKNIRIKIQGFALILILISCEKRQKFEYPLVYTGDVTNITDTSALFSANISCFGNYPILESGFIWGVHSNDNNGIKIKNTEDVDGIYSLSTNVKLLPGKTYYVRAYVQTKKTISYGREVSFESSKRQIDIGKWSQAYKDNLISGSIAGVCESFRFSFTINNIAYFASDDEFYSYNIETNTIKLEYSNPIIGSASNAVVIYNEKVYLFSGKAIYLFNPLTAGFIELSKFNVANAIYWGPHFLIDDNIFLGIGTPSYEGYTKDFWKFNITTNSWQQIAAFPGAYRSNPFSFIINDCGYVGGGYNNIYPYPCFNDLWCYNPEANIWIQKESLPFRNEEIYGLIGTNTESFGYCFYQKLFYEYNPVFDSWGKMAELNQDFCTPYIFSNGCKVFVLGAIGYNEKKYFNIWRYEK
jgi:N-acetylneuraminic acid mutarotase